MPSTAIASYSCNKNVENKNKKYFISIFLFSFSLSLDADVYDNIQESIYRSTIETNSLLFFEIFFFVFPKRESPMSGTDVTMSTGAISSDWRVEKSFS
jgi:hypothetical protein